MVLNYFKYIQQVQLIAEIHKEKSNSICFHHMVILIFYSISFFLNNIYCQRPSKEGKEALPRNPGDIEHCRYVLLWLNIITQIPLTRFYTIFSRNRGGTFSAENILIWLKVDELYFLSCSS